MNYKKTTKAELIKDHRSLVQKLAAAEKKLQKDRSDAVDIISSEKKKIDTLKQDIENIRLDNETLKRDKRTAEDFVLQAKSKISSLEWDVKAAASVSFVNQISLIQTLKALHRARFMLNAYAIMVTIIIALYFVLPIAVVGILAVLFVLTALMNRPQLKAEWQDNADAESIIYSREQLDKIKTEQGLV